ncbi:hypothetical protein ACRARG_07740 [Pseudooceanicola sp. C21-150M6]|uniref:hypothetical protein n=1 Tax=Pseudooceanicola sp. C21-150M6 TaxID=3434355 RepID=UPI003D7FFB4F
MIIAESIGFSATHSISSILSGLPGYDVAHGSQNFRTKESLALSRQTPAEFLAAMTESRQAGRTPVAVHTLFATQQMKPLCDIGEVNYWLIVRTPEKQIESCYAWIARKVLQGDGNSFLQVLNAGLQPLIAANLPTSLPNLLYYFACNHVTAYNLTALGHGVPMRKMETLLSDEAAFREAFAVPADIAIPHFANKDVHMASHSAKLEGTGLADPDRAAIRDNYFCEIGGRRYSIADMEFLAGYAG